MCNYHENTKGTGSFILWRITLDGTEKLQMKKEFKQAMAELEKAGESICQK